MKTNNTLLIVIAYLLMIIIWSTTPLAIKWSSQGIDFISGLSGRMLIGTTLAVLLSIFWYRHIPMHKQARYIYMTSALSIYGAMMMVYWGAQFIASGLVSVIYGLAPFFTAGFSVYILTSEKMTISKITGSMIAVAGLFIIFFEQLFFDYQAIWAMLAVLVSVMLHTISAVIIKRLNVPLPALIVTSGGLLFSLPLFLISFIVFADPVPEHLSSRTVWSIVYLGIMGSVIGFVSYYYVLAKLPASTVALATLITPVTALYLGKLLNSESITESIVTGTVCVLLGLIIHQYYQLLTKKLLGLIVRIIP